MNANKDLGSLSLKVVVARVARRDSVVWEHVKNFQVCYIKSTRRKT